MSTDRTSPYPRFELELPPWALEEVGDPDAAYPDDASRMDLAIRLARRNVREKCGGPFGAAVFRRRDGRLVAPGMNLVVPSDCSAAHAEVVALMIAQRRLGTFDLASVDGGCELVTSVEPCAMCLGAIPWSGVTRVVSGARDADARAIGFDEGAKPADWAASLRERDIEVTTDVLRDESAAVLREYLDGGGPVY